MILKTRWYDLDDGDDGISVDRVDWNDGTSLGYSKGACRKF